MYGAASRKGEYLSRITPEMIKAGKEVLNSSIVEGYAPSTDWGQEDLVKEIFEAIAAVTSE